MEIWWILVSALTCINGAPLQTVQEYSKNLCASEMLTMQPAIQEFSNAGDTEMRYLKDAGDDMYLYIGGNSSLYKINKQDMEDVKFSVRLMEVPNKNNFLSCTDSRPKDDCHNFINVAEELENQLLVCGSNKAYPACWLCNLTDSGSPTCTDGTYMIDASDLISSGPKYHTSWFKTNDSSVSYVFGGTELFNADSIFSKYILTVAGNVPTLEKMVDSDKANTKWLNKPAFVGEPIHYKDKLYFFYRETAVEYINAGKIIYSRVAQICPNDTGGGAKSQLLEDKWTTFLKARLNCSIQGAFPFYFDEIQDMFQSPDNEKLIYAVFTTPIGGPAASAVCIFNMENIAKIFETSSFKGQENLESIWLPTTDYGTGSRPGKCYGSHAGTTKDKFLRDYALVDTLIPNYFNEDADNVMTIKSLSPAVVVVNKRFVTIVAVPEANKDVFMIGTDLGTVIKAYYNRDSEKGAMVAEIDVAQPGNIQQMSFYKDASSQKSYVFVSTREKVMRIPFKFCGVYTKCSDCILARDIHCMWDVGNSRCIASEVGDFFDPQEDCSTCPTCPNSNSITIVQDLVTTERCSKIKGNIITMDFLAVSSRNIHLICNVNFSPAEGHNLKYSCDKGVTNNVDYCSCRIYSMDVCELNENVTVTIQCSGDDNTPPVNATTTIIYDKSDVKNDFNDLERFWKYQSGLMKYLYDLRSFKNKTLADCQMSDTNIHTCPAPVLNADTEESCMAPGA